jgi:hypothetical protein
MKRLNYQDYYFWIFGKVIWLCNPKENTSILRSSSIFPNETFLCYSANLEKDKKIAFNKVMLLVWDAWIRNFRITFSRKYVKIFENVQSSEVPSAFGNGSVKSRNFGKTSEAA